MSNQFIFIAIVVIFVFVIYKFPTKKKKPFNHKIQEKLDFVYNYTFPQRVWDAPQKKYPHLKDSDITLVIKALKEYFAIAILADGKMVAMPSQVVDVAWHEFLLFTKEYQEFSNKAFGRFFHHYPFENNNIPSSKAKDSLQRAWQYACLQEDINPDKPEKIPFLFDIDRLLDIPDGLKYKINDKTKKLYTTDNSSGSCSGYVGGCGGSYIDVSTLSLSSSSSSIGADSNSSGGDSSCGGGCGGGCGGN